MGPITLHFSRIAKYWTLCIHLLAFTVTFFLPLWWMVIGLLFCVVSLLLSWKPPAHPTRILVQPDFRLRLDWANEGEPVEVQISPQSIVIARLIILKLNGDPRCPTLILWPDSADRETLRLFRIWLRWVWPQGQH